MAIHRVKQNFTAGEVSPTAELRTDFDRHAGGCRSLKNMTVEVLGPVTRRPGTKFIIDLEDVGFDVSDPEVRLVPFIFNEVQAYTLVFFRDAVTGHAQVVFATGDGLVTDTGSVVYVDLGANFDIEGFDYAQSADVLYIAQAGRKPCELARTSHTSWTFSEITFADQPADWSDANGWPETITLFQQRLMLGGTALRRQTIWASKAGDFLDFGTSSPLVDSDAITFTLDSGTQNKIMWMQSGKALSVGTLGNEWTVTGNGQAPITPSSVLAIRQTNNGSEKIRPLLIDSTTLFVERHGRAINEFVYDYTFDSYKASDVLILTPHLTQDYSVTDWAYQQTPHSIIWCVRDDGDLIALTYQRQHKVIGWHVHNSGENGAFLRVCSIPGENREDDVWFVVRRFVDGQHRYYLEKFWPKFQESFSEYGRFLDSSILYEGAPATTFSGLDHLEGETVSVMADGYVHPDVVVTAGAVTLQKEAAVVLVGLPYTSEVSPLFKDIESQTGTMLGRKQRIVNVDVFLYNSLGFTIGVDNSEFGEAEDAVTFRRYTDPLGGAPSLFTGVRRVPFLEGWDRRTELFIRQSQPLPLTVLGLVDTVEVTE